jgi:drug/metabolite transporter (DMT)-like permease
MVQDGRSDTATFHLPRGETYVPPPGLAERVRSAPRGRTLLGLALLAAVAGTALLVARRRIELPGGDRLALLAARVPVIRRKAREVRHEAKVRGFWAGVLASAGSAVASTLARRLAEDVLASARERTRQAEEEDRTATRH